MDVFANVPNWGPETVAIGVVSSTDTLATYGPLDQVLPFASVTKPLTSYAMHCVAKAGLVTFAEPVDNPYTKGDVTLTHFLSHASGLPPDKTGVVTFPERKRIYSNFGYDVAADFVAKRVGMPFADVLREFVLEPLGMTSTWLHGSAGWEASGTVADLMRFATELLSPTLLDTHTIAHACREPFPGLSGVMPGFGRHDPLTWGVGFEPFAHKQPHWLDLSLPKDTFGHFGRLGGFLFVIPGHDVAAVSLSSAPFDDWARVAWPPFSRAVFETFG